MATRQPKKLGSYEVAERLGAGGMGEVFLTHHPHLSRPTAIKRVHFTGDERAVKNASSRFLREAQVWARIGHRNVAQVYDYFEQRKAGHLVLEYVDGIDLDVLLQDEEFLPLDLTLAIAAQTLSGLQAAHSENILHRDIKASNIRLGRDGVVKVLDFGIARAPEDERITRTGLVVGTPSHMAPEVLAGDDASTASDIYSVGVVLYRLLSGRRFARGASPAEVARSLRSNPPPSLREACSEHPVEVSLLIERMLSKSVRRRPDHAGLLAIVFETALRRLTGKKPQQICLEWLAQKEAFSLPPQERAVNGLMQERDWVDNLWAQWAGLRKESDVSPRERIVEKIKDLTTTESVALIRKSPLLLGVIAAMMGFLLIAFLIH